jgi:L-asparaginase II
MEVAPGVVVAKGGAEGLECIGLPRDGVGLAIKAEDGAARGIGPAAVALLDHLEALSAEGRAALEDVAKPVVKNHADLEVGMLDVSIRRVEAGTPPGAPALAGPRGGSAR